MTWSVTVKGVHTALLSKELNNLHLKHPFRHTHTHQWPWATRRGAGPTMWTGAGRDGTTNPVISPERKYWQTQYSSNRVSPTVLITQPTNSNAGALKSVDSVLKRKHTALAQHQFINFTNVSVPLDLDYSLEGGLRGLIRPLNSKVKGINCDAEPEQRAGSSICL